MDDPAGERSLTGPSRLIPDGLDATLLLVRHGESNYIVEERFQGQAETPLSPVGLRQSELVGRRVARAQDAPPLPVPARVPLEIVHSPLGRAAQTAEAIEEAFRAASGPPIPLRGDPGLLEIGQGEWEGLHRTEVDARYRAELAAWRRRPVEAWAPGGESLPEVEARVAPALRGILARLAKGGAPSSLDRPQVSGYRDAPMDQPWTIVVGHDGVFKVALLTLFDLPLERFWMWSMDLCGISVVELRAGRPVLRAHNLTAHLADLPGDRTQPDPSRSGAL